MRDCETASKQAIKMSVREKLEMRRARIHETIKYNEQMLKEIEEGLKMLNKNKELETLIDLVNL